MLEDEFYRSSTQYRHWSFTPAQLAEQRSITNSHAAGRVRAAFQRASAAKNNSDAAADEIDTLTVDEELKIIEWGSNNIIDLGERLNMPYSIVATAVQYLRRFYLMNSPMTYHPKTIQVCALFMATKACHASPEIGPFLEQADITEDEIKSPEFLLLQGNKFSLDVRHPFKGLDGGNIEIRAFIADGKILAGDKNAMQRVKDAVEKATAYLKREAQMTDAYFLFTPAQIWLAALQLADPDLTDAYLTAKFEQLLTAASNSTSSSSSTTPTPASITALRNKLTETVSKCAAMLRDYTSPDADKKERKELARIGRKLVKCQDPEKTDIVAVARAKRAEKREGSDSEREGEKKKRRLERERLERDGDVFGGSLRDV